MALFTASSSLFVILVLAPWATRYVISYSSLHPAIAFFLASSVSSYLVRPFLRYRHTYLLFFPAASCRPSTCCPSGLSQFLYLFVASGHLAFTF